MTALSDPHPRLAVSVGGGRLGRAEIELQGLLAALALFGVVFLPALGTIGAVVFLLAGTWLCVLNPAAVLDRAIRAWPVIAIALFAALSFTWSREPALSLRFGLQLTATIVIALAIAERLAPRAFCLALGGFLGLAMLASVAIGGVSGETAAWTGIYGSKNAFAGAAASFTILALGLGMARGRVAIRLGFLLAALPGIALVLLAQSVGALALLGATLLAGVAVLGLSRLGRLSGLVVAFGGLLLALFAGLLASAHLTTISAAFLDATGKDLTLTGRTELWAVALGLIAERPVLGVGYQAFWVKGQAEAEALWHLFGIESRSGFNFHNMYLSNAVEIGIAGVALQALVLFGAALLTLLWTLRTGSAIAAVFFSLTLMVVMASFIEVPLFFQFSLRTVLVVAAFAYARDARARGA
ncbi:MAG: O-antigen ligase family protein [Paracoccaceae bacterium]|nr:O-antigen ligase family protein [Paracoccaceae bacterium]